MIRLLTFTLLFILNGNVFAQYHNQTADIYSSKEGNLFVKASYTSTNNSRADRTIFLKSRNANSRSKDMLTWTNGGFNEVNTFINQLLVGLERGTGSTFQIGFMYSANVIDANNLKVYHKNGGYSFFNKTHMLLLKQAIKDIR
jgi:hypothetical protein